MEISHLLSLKVMRISKPTLATSSQPFFSTSPALSAHASASLMSLQGMRPLPGHPKTLRDFSLTELHTLPSTFGAISLGETFSSAFCINNECDTTVAGVHLRAEIQTATTKIPLVEFGGLEMILGPDEPLEGILTHEIKELNQHVLACTVSYLLPDNMAHNHNTGPPENPERPNLRVFRKYYKFTVTNPLSVKTKVHLPKSPSAIMSRTERDKVFLEVHVQNLSNDPMFFDRMALECVEGWDVEDVNTWIEDPVLDDDAANPHLVSLFSGTTAVMQPQDTRQYLYILSPKPEAMQTFPIIHQPGSSIPLGRLDISWRTGRLLTSVLSRKIPLLPVPPPAPAIPPHLQQVNRPQTPSNRPQSPGPRPQSPAFRVRNTPARPQSPGPSASPNPQHISRSDLEVDLVINHIPHDGITTETPFSIGFTLAVSAVLPSTHWSRGGPVIPVQPGLTRERLVRVVVQHVAPPRPAAISQSLANAQNANITPERMPRPPQRPALATKRSTSTLSLARRSESTLWNDAVSISTAEGTTTTLAQSPVEISQDVNKPEGQSKSLPAPFRDPGVVALLRPGQEPVDEASKEEPGVIFLGSSAMLLQPFRFSSASARTIGTPGKDSELPRGQASQDFNSEFYPLREGFATVGGLRVVVVEDREINADEVVGISNDMEPKIIREWDLIADVWVRASQIEDTDD